MTKDEKTLYQADYRAANREKNRLYQINYRKNNPDKIREIEENRKDSKKTYQLQISKTPEFKEKRKNRRNKPENKLKEYEYRQDYNNRPDVKTHQKAYDKNRDRTEYFSRPDVKEQQKIRTKKWNIKQKQLSILKYTPDDLKYSISDDPTFLYIVEHVELPILKIGMSKNVDNRLMNIKCNFGEVNPIFVRPFDNCRHIETSLHNQFEDYKYNEFKSGDGEGYTEWFYKDCLTKLSNIFNTNKLNTDNTVNLLQCLEIPN